MKHFDEKKWREAIRHPDWPLRLADDVKRFQSLPTKNVSEEDRRIREEMKEEIYSFFEKALAAEEIFLAKDGPDQDRERKPITAIVIHHTHNPPGMTPARLSAIHLFNLYMPNYKEYKGQAIYSHHFDHTGRQVFYAYHWFVRTDGTTERLLRDNEIGWQAGNWDVNCKSIAICIDDNVENSTPKEKVITAISDIIKTYYPSVSPDQIFGHREINPKTTCPGEKFLSNSDGVGGEKGWKQTLIDSIISS